MNFYEMEDHMKNKTPFIVYGDVCRYDPAIHEGDPHGWYRLEISKANIAVNVESEAEYYKNRDILLEKLNTLQARLTLTEAALSAAEELLSMSTAENNYLSAFSTCDICNAPTWSGHEETCEYRIAKERYQTALDALDGVMK